MVEIPILKDIVIIFGFSTLVLLICHRIKIPSIVGFLLTGIIIGPHTFGLVKSLHDVEILAEIGIVLLLFTIGIEFSFKKILQAKKFVLLGGLLQVFLTTVLTYIVARQFALPIREAVFAGFLIALSSTAIVLKILQERAELDSPHGRAILSILIFQDIAIVPMIIFAPLLAGHSTGSDQSLPLLIIKGVVIIVIALAAARYLIPGLMFQIARTRSRELFLLSIALICIAVAWMTSQLGLSLGLGAFLAGLVISESEYNYRALEGVLPFRDVFTSFFFVSVGMLLNTSFLIENPLSILAAALAILVVKSILAGTVAVILGLSVRAALIVGLALCQVGEFSFILSKVGIDFKLLDTGIYQGFLAVSIFTMAATPFIITFSPIIAERAAKWPILKRFKSRQVAELEADELAGAERLKDHLIIVGFGINGRNLARAARAANIRYVIIEMNPDTVKNEREKGEPIRYGDATGEGVFKKAHIGHARVLAVAISDPVATRRITEIARRMNPRLHIIVRTRFVQEMKPLYYLGANEVIPEEFETSVEIFTLVLMKYLVPRDEIERFIREIRSDSYEMFRSLSRRTSTIEDLKLHFSEIDVCTLRVAEKAPVVGRDLGDLELRKKYGVTVLAIERDSEVISNPGGSTKICGNDVLFILGTPDQINNLKALINA